MSALPKAMRTMRIIALPLARPKIPPDQGLKPHAVFNPNRMLIFYHFDLSQGNNVKSQDQSSIKRAVKWASTKAADLWAGFGKAPEGSWKLRTYELGERIADHIDFEELALKGVDPSLGPSIDITGQEANEVNLSEKPSPREALRIPLIYPPSIYASLPSTGVNEVPHPSIVHLRTLLTSREPRHRRGFWIWMAIAPLTAPFMIVRESSGRDTFLSNVFSTFTHTSDPFKKLTCGCSHHTQPSILLLCLEILVTLQSI
jgi:hypothetical protein